MRTRVGLAIVCALATVTAAACEREPSPWRSTLVSVNAAGTDAGGAASMGPVFSPDGTKVAFVSGASNLAPATTTTGGWNVYVRDLTTGATTLATGTSSAGESLEPAFSPDGNLIAFTATAGDLGPTDTNGRDDVYVRNLATGEVTLVSANAAGTNSGNAGSNGPRFSPDGTKMAFTSDATTLGPTDTNGRPDVYVRDLLTGTTTLVSVNAAGTGSGNGISLMPSFSPSGQVAFLTMASNLGPADTNGVGDLYLRDLATGTTTLITANAAGTDAGNVGMFLSVPAFSGDGSKVVFTSSASNLVAGDGNDAGDVFLRDLPSGRTTLVSVAADGSGGNASSFDGTLSPDGTKVVFTSMASNLGPTDSPRYNPDVDDDIYLRDLTRGTTTLLSVDATGRDSGEAQSFGPTFSPDGTKVAFGSESGNLGPTDTNGMPDLYLRDLVADTTVLVSAAAGGRDTALGASFHNRPSFSPDSTRIAFESEAEEFGPTDTNYTWDVYLATLQGADLSVALEADPTTVAPGGRLTYRLTLTNSGPEVAEDVKAVVVVPTGAEVAEVLADGLACSMPTSVHPDLVACEADVLRPGDSAGADIVVAAGSADSGDTLHATAVARASTLDPDHADDTANVDVTVA